MSSRSERLARRRWRSSACSYSFQASRNARVTSSSPASVMLPSWTFSSRSKMSAVAWRSAPSRPASWPDHDVHRAAVDALQRLLHPLGGEHAAVVVSQDESRLPGQPRGHDRRQHAHQHQRDRQRRLGQQQLAPQASWRAPPLPSRRRARPGRAPPGPAASARSARGAASTPAGASGRRRFARRRASARSPGSPPPGSGARRRTTSAPSSRASLGVGQQVALRLGVDLLGRLLRGLDEDDEPVGAEPARQARALAQQRAAARRRRRQADHHAAARAGGRDAARPSGTAPAIDRPGARRARRSRPPRAGPARAGGRGSAP